MTALMELTAVAVVSLGALWGLVKLASSILLLIKDRALKRRARLEAELDRTQAQLRATILNLASQLGTDAHEARKTLIRESFIAAQVERQSPKR
jgi:uncharacterized protein YdiU (UPF0061 family)